MALVGDAAGYVTKCSGEGIYFAAKSGRMAAEAVVQCVKQTGKLPTEKQLKQTYIKDYDKLYKPTYLVLDILQKVRNDVFVSPVLNYLEFERGRKTRLTVGFQVSDEMHPSDCLPPFLCFTMPVIRLAIQVFYSNNAAREAFVELCESEYVQKVTFDSYLYKKVTCCCTAMV